MLKIVGTLKGSRLFKSATLSSSNADLKEAIKQAQSQTPASNNNETLSPVASPIRKSESNPTQIFHEKETIEFLDSQPKLSSGGSIYCLVCQNVVTQVVSVPVDNPCRCSLGLEVSSSENTGAAASEDLTPIEFGTIRCCFRCITEELDKGTTPSCSKCGRAVVFSKEAQPPVSIESLNSFLDPTLQQEIDQLPTYCKYNSRWWAKRVEQRREMFKQAAPSENSELASEVSEEQMSKLLEAAAEDVEIPENQSETEAKPKGCEDIIPLGKREEHQLVCNFVPVVCGQRDTERRGELCTHECPRGSLSEHRTICAYRTQKCPNEACHRQVSLRSLARHLPLCEFQQVSCPNGCNKKVLKIGLENHTYQDCVMSCDWDIDEYVKKEGLSPEEHVDLLKKKVKFQTEKAKQLSQEISRYEKMHESTHPENFTGIYFVPLYEPKCRNADYEWICKVYDSKYKNEFRQHLTAVLLNESHPVGRVFHEVRVNTLENCASARRNLSAEVISKIGSMLLVKAGIVHKSVVATWPLYKEIESCREFIQNLLISLVYEQVFALYLSKNATDDKNLSQKMIELSSLTPTHLGIRKEFCLNMDIETGATKKTQDTDYDSDADSATSSNEPKQYVFSAGAINIFKQIFEFANVKEKIDCLVATIQLICNSVKNFLATTGQKETEDIGFVSADDLLPMLCFVVVHAGVPNLFSELRFIIDFSRDEKELSGQTGYCISMLEGAMEHILTLNYEELIQQHGPPLTDSSDSVTDSPGETSNVHVPIVENTTATNDNNSEQSAGPKGPSMEHEWRIVCDLDANETMFARYSCCHNSLTRKGSLYVSTNYLVFIPTGKDKNDQKVKINFKDIYSVHKTKFAVVDNSIDVYIKVDKEKEKEHEVDFVIYKFVHFDNVTQAFVQICKIHQTVQLTLESPITPLLIHDQSIDYSDEFLDGEFSKLRNGLLNGVYDCETEEEAYLYTAVLCHVTMGDWSPTKYRPSFIRAKVKLIPPAFRENFSEDQIYEQFKRLKGANEIVAKLYFVMRIRAVVRKMMGRYGLQIFFVKEGLSDKKVKPVILGISREAILRMDIETLEVISQHSLSEVTRISANQNNLIIDYSSAEASFYQCRTNQAQYITEIFNGMIKAILSRDY